MKIGILTWFFGANYGAKAHTLGLQNYLSGLGIQTEIINYIPENASRINIRMNAKKPYYKNVVTLAEGIKRCKEFQNFNENFILSPRVYNSAEIDNLGYDLILLGSDEIFNLVHPLNDLVYYGVGILKTPCICYAPSMGQMPEKTGLGPERIKSLSHMPFLSARDMYTQNILIKQVCKEVALVCDPTFLYDFKRESYNLNIQDYILIYSFEDMTQYQKRIKQYAQATNRPIVVVGRKLKWADYSYPAADESFWLGAFKKASLVITDSFHGTVFSIKNNKDYVVIDRSDKTNKIVGLHNYLNIEKNFYNGSSSIEEYMNQNKLDFGVIRKNVSERISESKLYLEQALNHYKE